MITLKVFPPLVSHRQRPSATPGPSSDDGSFEVSHANSFRLLDESSGSSGNSSGYGSGRFHEEQPRLLQQSIGGGNIPPPLLDVGAGAGET